MLPSPSPQRAQVPLVPGAAGAAPPTAVTAGRNAKEAPMSTATQNRPSFSPRLSPGWSLALGVLLLIAGIAALLYPVIAAVAAALYIGWFALIAGVIAVAIAIKTRAEPEFGWRLLVGVLYLRLGRLLVANPITANGALTNNASEAAPAMGLVEIV